MHLLFVPNNFFLQILFLIYPIAVKILHILISKAQIKKQGITKATLI